MTRVINDYARKFKILKDNDANLTGEDIREGLSAIISVKLTEPQFEGQTKTKLGNAYIRSIVDSAVAEGLNTYLVHSFYLSQNILYNSFHLGN